MTDPKWLEEIKERSLLMVNMEDWSDTAYQVSLALRERATLLQAVEEYREALEFYADDENYDEEGRPGNLVRLHNAFECADEADWDCDLGFIAETALKWQPGESNE